MDIIPVCYRLSTRKTAAEDKKDEEYDQYSLAELILQRGREEGAEERFSILERFIVYRYVLSDIILKDRKNTLLNPIQKCYNPFSLDELMFVFAEVEEPKRYGSKCYILCNYLGSNQKMYKGVFIVPYEDYVIEDSKIYMSERKYLIGTCVRKAYSSGSKADYDKYSKQTYVTKSEEKKNKTKMLTFALVSPDVRNGGMGQ